MWSLFLCPSWIWTGLTRPPPGPSLTGSTLCSSDASECSEDAATATRLEGRAARTTSPGSDHYLTCPPPPPCTCCLWRINGQLVALKEIRMKTEEGVPFTAIREASLLKGLKHANIVVLHDIIHTRESLTFVFEYVQTDLAQYLNQHPGGLHSHNVRLFMFQLLRALCFIHSRRILHRDLKPHNLLISYLGELKMADFGLARSKSIPSQTFSSEVVTLWYRPPDVLLGSTDYSTALDIWGAGCIFVEMLQGAPAFPGVTDEFEQLQKIWTVLGVPSEDSWPGVSQLPNYTPGQFKYIYLFSFLPYKTEDLVQRMLKVVPADRISAQDSVQHPFFSTLPPPIMHLRDSKNTCQTPLSLSPLVSSAGCPAAPEPETGGSPGAVEDVVPGPCSKGDNFI
uniref:mitogen-activated protein kinase n=1 Tax=Cyclopterus lumpus TaxID=8103 RepID=A0A8C2ZBU0_CYCLU